MLLGLLILALVVVLLGWALQGVPFARIGATLGNLEMGHILLLLLVNTGIILLFALRWWLILRRQGIDVPYLALTLFRLAGFGVSYFTPGPQFGGEPLQVFLLHKRRGVSAKMAATSVALDKLIELIANFAFLLVASGLVFLFSPELLGQVAIRPVISMGLLLLPLIYLGVIWNGRKPLSWLGKRIPRWQEVIAETEGELADLVRGQPRLLVQALLASAVVWLALVAEYRLALGFLGLRLELLPVLTIMLLARLAMLAPTPGALGTLEAALVLAMNILGLDAAFALALAVLIRGRDLLFGGFGLLFAAGLGLPRPRAPGAW